jgi:hypothetical protein
MPMFYRRRNQWLEIFSNQLCFENARPGCEHIGRARHGSRQPFPPPGCFV